MGISLSVNSGNNAIAYVGAQRVTTTQSSAPLNFIYVQDPTVDPDAVQANIDAARVNAFYVVNTVHDISYLYGFTEDAFNFQNNNFGKGGLENDRIEISVQIATRKNDGELLSEPSHQRGSRVADICLMQRFSASRLSEFMSSTSTGHR